MAKTYLKLRGRIIEKFGTQEAFGKALNVSIQTVCAKLNGRSAFSQDDIIKWCELLDISASEVGDYFFAPALSNG